MGKDNNLVRSCEDDVVISDDRAAAYGRDSDFLRITLLVALASVINIVVLVVHCLIQAVSQGDGGSAWSVAFQFVVFLHDLHIKACFGKHFCSCLYQFHQVFGEGFYLVDVMVKRLSESQDIIPVMVSERLVDVSQDYQGEWICISGQFRSYNRHEEKKNRLVLSVFARELSFVEEEDDSVKSNQIYLDGYICKPPVYRKTPLGREIADLLIAVNRPYGKSDYIPCICWGRNARYASAFAVGGHVLIWGRIQSREYMKRLSETEMEKRTAYEVSVSKLEYSES